MNSLEYRFKCHLNDNRQDNNKFHNAIKKYGKEHFQIELVEECPDKQLDAREKYWIQYYDSVNNGYNTTWGGSNGFRYNRELLLNLWTKGLNILKISEQTGIDRGLLVQILKNEGISDEEIKSRHYIANRIQKKNRKISQIDTTTGDVIKIWNIINDIERELKINHSLIIACCNLKAGHKTAGGYAWRYTENYNPLLDKVELLKTIPKRKCNKS